jgi:hypothetical protein
MDLTKVTNFLRSKLIPCWVPWLLPPPDDSDEHHVDVTLFGLRSSEQTIRLSMFGV